MCSYQGPFHDYHCDECETPAEEPCVCGGTGNHDNQPITMCDECAEHGPWEAMA